MTEALLVAIVFAAAFVQSLAGFGFALMVMPPLALLIGLNTAAPLVAVVALILNTINFACNREALDRGDVVRLALASAPGVPLGIWALARFDEQPILRLLGLILILYAAHNLLTPALPALRARWLAYPLGFLAGCLGGAYNTPAPPLVVYGSLRQWRKEEFRAALHGLFCINGLLVVISHGFAGNLRQGAMSLVLIAAPAVLLAVLLASRIDRHLNGGRFRVLVTLLILVLGLTLILG